MVIWFQAASYSKSREAPGGHSSRHTRHTRRKKHSAQHKKHPAFQCMKNTTGKGGKSETKVCCPLCEEMLSGDDGLLDHFGEGMCPNEQCTSKSLKASKAQVGGAKSTCNDQYSCEPARGNKHPEVSIDGPSLASVQPEASSDGPVLTSIGPEANSNGLTIANAEPEANSDGPSASSKRKSINGSKYNKFSYRTETDLEKADCSLCKTLVGEKRRIKC